MQSVNILKLLYVLKLLQFFLLREMFLKKGIFQEFVRQQSQKIPYLQQNFLIFSFLVSCFFINKKKNKR